MDETKTSNGPLDVFMSREINELASALAQFQASVEQPKLDKEVSVRTKSGSSYKFKYADLSACVKVAAPVLRECGLAVSQVMDGSRLVTILAHKSGQWVTSVMPLMFPPKDYQDFGSAITYMKRYSYCSILGIVASDDDDANIACGNDYNYTADKNRALQLIADEISRATTSDQLNNIYANYRDTPLKHDVYKLLSDRSKAITQ